MARFVCERVRLNLLMLHEWRGVINSSAALGGFDPVFNRQAGR